MLAFIPACHQTYVIKLLFNVGCPNILFQARQTILSELDRLCMSTAFLFNFAFPMAQYLLQINIMKVFRRNKQLKQTLDDIVFENRNKGYGCYYLRATYHRRLQFSFVLVLFIFLFATLLIYFWKINPIIENSDKIDNTNFESVKYNPEMIPMLIRLPEVPKENPAALIVATEPTIATEQRERPNYKRDMPLAKFKPVLPIADTSYNKLADDLLKRHKDILTREMSVQLDSIKFILEKVPQFPGGNAAIQSYFLRNQHYPVNALLTGIQGSTIVSFVVNEKGMVEDAKVVSGIDPELDMEAIRLVKSMPHWQPAYYKGKPIACMLILPVDFAIK